MTLALDNEVRLPDGRTLGYAEYGDPNGLGVLHFHGIPGSRYQAAWPGHDDIAKRVGVRALVLERPGVGLSDFQPGRTIASWPDDVAAFAAALGLKRFGVLGFSGGSPYALACALHLPERVAAACVVGGAAPVDLARDRETLSGPAEALAALILRSPNLMKNVEAALRLPIVGMAHWLGKDPEAYLARQERAMPDVDRRTLAEPDARAVLIKSWQEAFRQGTEGMVLDSALNLRAWDLDLRTLRVPIRLWHGEADRTVPPQRAFALAEMIPDCRLILYPDEGHFSLFANHYEEILAQIAA